MATPLPPPPKEAISNIFAWREWFYKLWQQVTATTALYFNNLNFTGSNITSIEVRNHNDLTTIQGGTALQRYHLTQVQWNYLTNPPYIEVYDLSTSIALSSTPALLMPATTGNSSGITYDNTTGVFTFTYAGSYALALSVNALASASNQYVYIYAENNTGSGWVANPNSGKYFQLSNGVQTQIVYSQAVHRAAGQQVRYWIYSNGVKVILTTATLPSTSTVYVPAIRIQYA